MGYLNLAYTSAYLDLDPSSVEPTPIPPEPGAPSLAFNVASNSMYWFFLRT